MTAYPNSPPKMLPSFICYVDILGFSQLSLDALKENKGNQFLNKLKNALSLAYERIRDNSKRWDESEAFKIKVFTDNIVVGYPISLSSLGKGESELGDIFSMFSEFQVALSMEGFLVRGGISFGEHYMDDDIVFGDALLEAVAQDKDGGSPCISLASSAIKQLRYHLGSYRETNWAPQFHYLLEDSDGTIYLNYLEEAFIAYPDGGIFFDVFDGHKKMIEEGLGKYNSTPGIVSKYEWTARYHNYICEEFAKNHQVPTSPDADEIYAAAAVEAQKLLDYKIDISSYASKPKRISLEPIKL